MEIMISYELNIDKTRLFVWESEGDTEKLLKGIESEDLLREYANISSDKRKREYLLVRLALKNMLGKETLISYDSAGKPFLPDKRFNISISHSGRWVAVIIHPEKEVGVDIECRSERVLRVYKRFLSEEEQQDLSEGQNLTQLQIAWSAKETLYKIIGKDAVDFASQLRIFPFKPEAEGVIEAIHTVTGNTYKLLYRVSNEYVLVYCIS